MEFGTLQIAKWKNLIMKLWLSEYLLIYTRLHTTTFLIHKKFYKDILFVKILLLKVSVSYKTILTTEFLDNRSRCYGWISHFRWKPWHKWPIKIHLGLSSKAATFKKVRSSSTYQLLSFSFTNVFKYLQLGDFFIIAQVCYIITYFFWIRMNSHYWALKLNWI